MGLSNELPRAVKVRGFFVGPGKVAAPGKGSLLWWFQQSDIL